MKLNFILLVLSLSIVQAAIKAYLVQSLWSWYFVSLNIGLPDISLLQAFGVSLVISALTHNLDVKNDYERVLSNTIASCITYGLVLWVAYYCS